MVRACSPGRLPLGPHRGRGGAWTVSSTWLKYLGPGPGEGASLKGGSCAPVPAQPQRRGVSDRRGGTSRTGAKRAGECDGLTGLPEANAGSPDPRPRPVWSTRFRAPGCGSSPTGTAGRSRPLSRPICTAPNQEAAWQALTDFSESDTGVKYPQTVTTWERAWERFTPFLDFPPMLRRVISPPLRGYPLNQQYRGCELPAAQGSPMNRGHFPFSMRRWPELPKAGDLRHLWTNEPENATRRKDCHHPSAGPRASSSKDRSPPTRYKGPGPAHHRLPRPNQPLPVKRSHRKLDRPDPPG